MMVSAINNLVSLLNFFKPLRCRSVSAVRRTVVMQICDAIFHPHRNPKLLRGKFEFKHGCYLFGGQTFAGLHGRSLKIGAVP